MKKKLTAIALVVCMLAVMLVGASLAYFTDEDTKTNTFTVGNVDIRLIESNLHRSNAGYSHTDTPGPSNAELWSNVEKEGKTSDKKLPYFEEATYYTDEQIEKDAKTYNCTNVKLNPGQSYHKMPYVVNDGENDAYIRIRVMIPAELDTTVLNSSMYTGSAISSGEFTNNYDDTGTVTRPYGKNNYLAYNVYTFTRNAPLEPGQMTTWNVWGTIHMDDTVTNDTISGLFGAGKTFADGTFPVLVEADAIQADGFANATAAFEAFDAE